MSAQLNLVANNQEPSIDPESKLGFALRYAAIGWHVFPVWNIGANGACACGDDDCKAGKHPLHKLVQFGQSQATTDEVLIKRWWTQYPEANIAALLSKSNLCAIDIDPRNGGLFDIERIEAEHGPLVSDVLQYTGGGGEHRVFQLPANQSLPGKLAKGIDVKANGYIVLEPSNHISGGSYTWEASSDPLCGAIASPLPDWLRDLARTTQTLNDDAVGPALALSPEQITELESALVFINADDRDVWLNVGMAIQNDLGGGIGFDLWNTWSEKSTKYVYKDQLKVWNSFKRKGISGVTKATLFKMAQDAGWHNAGIIVEVVPTAVDIVKAQIYKKPEFMVSSPTCAPGILGRVQDYYNATAKIQQPMFAIQTALGCGSSMLGRMFKTEYGDYTSLYFLNIAGSAKGKEHIKTTTEAVLYACGFGDLLAGNGYTSQGAVFSTLKHQPSHITVIDELGIYLENSTNKANFIGRAANKTLMECIGRCGGVMRNQNYSDRGVKDQIKENIHRPAITLQTMTTPSTFYKNLTIDQISDGFLGRFIVHHSKEPRTVPARIKELAVYPEIVAWAEAITERLIAHDQLNTRSSVDNVCDAIIIKVSKEADARQLKFAHEMVDLMNELEATNIEALAGRSAELAGRLALIAALACDPLATTIDYSHADWACTYMLERALEMVNEVRENMNGSQHAADKKFVLSVIRAAGSKGLTARDMARTAGLIAYRDKDLNEILAALTKGGLIAYANVREGKPGKKREAYFALVNDDLNDE